MKCLHPTIAAAIAAALALAPAAYAQATCSAINTLNGHGLDEFDDIIADEIDEDFYDASFWLDGAEECSVEYGTDAIYSCMWVFDTQAEAARALSSQLAVFGSCLTGWTREATAAETTASYGIRILEGASFQGSGNQADLQWGVFTEEHTSEDGADWHVIALLAYFW